MAAIAQMNIMRIKNPYTHNGRIANPAERILLLVLLFLTGLLSSCSQQGKTANKEEGVREAAVDSVVIKIIPWDIVTDVNIRCENFETSTDYKVCTVKDSRIISKLLSELSQLRISQKGGEDIRCKLIFYQAGKIWQSDCVGRILTKIESDYYYTSPKLIATINSIVNNPQTKMRKEKLTSWNPSTNAQKIIQYINSQSDRLYNGIELKEDLNFTVFCSVGEGGKTIDLSFSNCSNGTNEEIPPHIVSVIQDIFYNEIKWDVPSNHHAQWVPVKISIKSNK